MFYSQDLLTKRGSGFAFIWLAATAPKSKIITLKRRDYLSVDIEKTCEAIQLHLDKKRKQFALYLSSQLMYGVVRVYKMQHTYLLSDASTLMTKCTSLLQMQTTEMLIDLKAGPGSRVTNVLSTPDLGKSDLLFLDPDFGTLKTADLVGPDEIPDIVPLNMPPRERIPSSGESQEGGSGHELSQEKIRTPQILMSPVADQPHTVPNDRISIKDTPLISMDDIQIPGEVDLPPLTDDGVERLMSTTTEEEDPLREKPTVTTDGSDSGNGKPSDSTDQGPGDMDLQQLAPTEDTPAELLDPYLIPSPRRKRKRGRSPVSPDVTRLSPVQPPPNRRSRRDDRLDLDSSVEPGTVTPGRRRPRMLRFLDRETQIRRRVLRGFLADTRPIVRSMELPAPNLQNYTRLFDRPGRQDMGRTLLQMWRDNCKTRTISTSEAMQPWDGDSSRSSEEALGLTSVELESPDEVRRSRDETPEGTRQPLDSGRESRLLPTLPEESLRLEESVGLGLESMERGRDVSREQSRNAGQLTPHASVLEKSGRSARSRSASFDRTFTEEQGPSRHSGLQESSIGMATSLHGDLSGLGNILEESREVSDMSVSFITKLGPHEFEPMTSPQHRNVYRSLKHNTRDAKVTAFSTLCPLTMNRKQVAKTFSCMLDFLGKERIFAEQEEPYAEIYIYSERQ